MEIDSPVTAAIYSGVAATGKMPSVAQVADSVGATVDDIRVAYSRLYQRRLLVLEPDGVSICIAPPFSGVPTKHRVRVGDTENFANCAWDAHGVLAALHRSGQVVSRCVQTHEPLLIRVDDRGPEPIPCVIHFAVPAALWWRDIVFT
jgi:hypothetical protein